MAEREWMEERRDGVMNRNNGSGRRAGGWNCEKALKKESAVPKTKTKKP